MKITVIVPIYNTEPFLCKCIDSLLSQTRIPDEILLIDDGSTDASGKICDKYSVEYENVIAWHKENEGLGPARNYGMERACGDYILFIDSDDYLDDDYLSVMERKIKETNCDTCKTTFKRFDERGNVSITNSVEEKIYTGKEIIKELVPRMIGSSPEKADAIPMSSCCTMYSSKIISENNIKFMSERKFISEDIIFNLQYYSYSEITLLSDYVGYNYRINNNSLTTVFMEDRFDRCKYLVIKEKEMLIDRGIYDTSSNRLSKQFFIYTRMSIEQLKNSNLTLGEKNSIIYKICNDTLLKECIDMFPRAKLGIKQRIFIELIRFKQIRLLRMLLAS